MITKEDLNKHLSKLFSTVTPGDIKAIHEKMSEHLKYALDNYDILDPEAKTSVDKSIDIIKEFTGKAIDLLPESKEKRSLQRQHAQASGRHFEVNELIKILEAPPDPKLKIPIAEAARDIFVKRLQNILDLLYDITKFTTKGSANFAKLSLLYSCIDELLVAFHLAQRAFTTQSYAHIRTVFEFLEKIELFTKQPQWAELWASDDEKLKLKELKPSEVRKKLGKDKIDLIYGFFSEMGLHGTFKSVQAKSARREELSSKGNIDLRFWIGGSPQVHHIVWTHSFLIYALTSVILGISKAFSTKVNEEDTVELLVDMAKEFKEFSLKHFLKWAKESELDTKGFEEDLNRLDSVDKI